DHPSLWRSVPLLDPDKDNFSLLNIAIHLIVSPPVSPFSGMSLLHCCHFSRLCTIRSFTFLATPLLTMLFENKPAVGHLMQSFLRLISV
ncbi:hypothetical protein GOODEAATRI_033136, partial [Goodea atripinnis]